MRVATGRPRVSGTPPQSTSLNWSRETSLTRSFLAPHFTLTLAVLAFGSVSAHGFSQVTHEQLIDILWVDSIRPLLLERYPGTTEAALTRAHAFAYGGCLIQDIGYYPFGKTFFSELAHYVRSGDFVASMLHNARNVDELAFAVGALSHYVGDSIGHSEAVNSATALMFPDLEAKFGPVVRYEDAPVAHARTEFGFDVTQTAWQRYAPRAYRKSIGFQVARRLLYRTFQEVYGVRAGGILGPARSALPTYHWAVASLLPAFLRAQVVLLGGRLPVERSDDAQRQFLAHISHAEYATKWRNAYSKPGIRSHLFAFVILMVPKLGRLKALSIKSPTTETEDLFLQSVNDAVETFRTLLADLRRHPGIQLKNVDLDTGKTVAPGESEIVDRAHAELLMRIIKEKIPHWGSIRNYLLLYYSDPTHSPHSRSDPQESRRLAEAIRILRAGER